jgi:hypothetical protein
MQAAWAGRRTRPTYRNRRVPVVAGAALVVLALLAGPGPLAGAAGGAPLARAAGHHRGVGRQPRRAATSAPQGPSSAYDCTFNLTTDAFTGADGTASQIGWEGNHQGVVTCLGGTFLVQDGIDVNYGFGIYGGGRTTWQDADGYLPAQITSFRHAGSPVSITEFADRVVIGGDAYVAVYARVAVSNPTDHVVVDDPDPSSGLVPISTAPDAVSPHSTADHDYVVAADRFGNDYPWPTSQALADAGSFDDHFAHMQDFWNEQLSGIAEVQVPDASLDDAYRSGFIYTQIARSGNDLNTGVNGYESEFSHDVVGILTNLFTQGYYTDAHALLLEARNVVGSQGQYVDGVWTYAVPWAVYLMKTGDVAFVRQNFSIGGPAGDDQPSIEDTAHELVADRTGLGGIMEATDDIDTQGYWTTDDYEALLGLAAYRYLAAAVGDTAEATWATQEYRQLLSATNAVLDSTISRFDLDYLPCSIVQPNTANRCSVPEDANWTSPFGFGSWAWEGYLFGAPRSGPGLSLIDATYDYGFGRLTGLLPRDDAGGFPGDYYSSGYNAAVGAAGLASTDHRDQGILDYQFMVENSQSGPYSWWESSSAPSSSTPWIGRHPAAGQGASPHAWGMAGANKVLLDSLVAQRSDGALIVGRGVPDSWLGPSQPIAVTDFPTTDGRRVSLTIASHGRSVSLALRGQLPTGPVLFELPSFVHNLATASAGRIDQATGTVTLAPGTRSVTVELRRAPGSVPSEGG